MLHRLAVCLCALAACLAADRAAAKPKVTRQIAVTTDFTALELNWTSGKPVYRGFWRVITSPEGVIEICGAGHRTDASDATRAHQWLYAIFVTLNDKKIMQDVTYFTDTGLADPKTAKASCRSTGVKAPKGEFTVYLGWPPG